jgi:hypothetical protein
MSINRMITDDIKLARGCAVCGFREHPAALHFDHIDPATKYRTRSGKVVHPSDLIKGDRYPLATVLAEVAKCRVVCANHHAIHTHKIQRGG